MPAMIRTLPYLLLLASASTARSADTIQPGTIEIGQPIADVESLLRGHRIDFVEGGLSLAKGDNDTTNLYLDLDKDSTAAAIFYSKANGKVTSITLIFHPKGNSAKQYQSWLSAKSIRVEQNQSYSIHFLPPSTQPKSN